MSKHGKSSSIIFVLLIMILIVLAWIFVFNAYGKTRNTGSISEECKQLEKEVFIFGDKNCYSNSAIVFTLYSGKEINALRILVHTSNGVKSIDLTNGVVADNVGNFEGTGYIYLPQSGEMSTYIIHESADALEVIPKDKNGNECKASDSIVLSRCDDSFSNILDKNINLSEYIFLEDRGSSGDSERDGDGGNAKKLASPILTIYSPLNGAIFNITQIRLNFAVSGEEIVNCLYKVANGSFVSLGNCISPAIVNVGEGEQNIVLRAVNSQDRFGEKTISIIVDTIPPILSNFVISPSLASGVERGDILNVDFDSSELPIFTFFRLISDANGAIVNYTSPVLIGNENQTNLSYTVPSGLNMGNYTLRIVAVDKAGNTADFFAGTIMINDSYTGTCDDSQIILRLAKESNSHASAWDNSAYAIKICYNEIFGELYIGSNPHNCKSGASNIIAYLYSLNGHLSGPDQSVSGVINICYGDLDCRSVNGACAGNEKEIVSLTSLENAHVELNSLNNYNYKICCK